MKLEKTVKIEGAASQDETRFALNAPYLDITEGHGTLVATDGRMLARMPVELEDGDTAGYVPVAALAAARKVAKKGEQLAVRLNGQAIVSSAGQEATFARNAAEAQFPNWRQVIPKDEPKARIALNPELLLRLAKAIGSEERIVLEIMGETSPIRIRALSLSGVGAAGDRAPLGVLMPIRTA